MIVAVTGTPGTGKTAVARALADRLGYEYVDVNAVAGGSAVETERDEERATDAVDVDSLVEALEQAVGQDAVLDGHLAHHFPADLTVVLRCSPDELEQRLEAKGWDDDKVRENVEAEVLDLTLQQAAAERDRVMEVDTTGKEAGEVVDTVVPSIRSGAVPERLQPGHVNWEMDGYLPGDG